MPKHIHTFIDSEAKLNYSGNCWQKKSRIRRRVRQQVRL